MKSPDLTVRSRLVSCSYALGWARAVQAYEEFITAHNSPQQRPVQPEHNSSRLPLGDLTQDLFS